MEDNDYERITQLKNPLDIQKEDNCPNDTFYLADESKQNLLQTLSNNFYGSDFLLCLFIAALKSYKVDKCLRPFPPLYVKQAHKDFDRLRKVCENLPRLEKIIKEPQMCSNEIIQLLMWIFCQKEQPSLRRIDYNNVPVPNEIKKSHKPHYVFEIVYPPKAEIAWNKRKGSRSSFLCYHGSKIDNFYSILKVGLQQHFELSKELLYGRGIYLTTEITVSITFSPFGRSWTKSILGSKHSCLALCEVIDDVDKVKYQDEKYDQRAINKGSISGKIPDKYYVVTDNEMVRVRYFFLYKENTVHKMESWLYNHLFILLIGVYVVILVGIGFFQGPTWSRLQTYLYKTLFSN